MARTGIRYGRKGRPPKLDRLPEPGLLGRRGIRCGLSQIFVERYWIDTKALWALILYFHGPLYKAVHFCLTAGFEMRRHKEDLIFLFGAYGLALWYQK